MIPPNFNYEATDKVEYVPRLNPHKTILSWGKFDH